MDIEARLSALETIVTAAPSALSVATLQERVTLGDAAKASLERTLSPWDRTYSNTLRRHSLAGRTSVELTSGPWTVTVRYQTAHLESRWPLGTDDAVEAEHRADLLLTMARFRLESDPVPA